MTNEPLRVLGYVRRSTDKQAMSPETQARRLRDAADVFGWDLTTREEEAASAKSLDGRPVLAEAMDDCDRGRADALAVAALDRLARSTRDFADVLDRSERRGWSVVCLDLGVDTSTESGRLVADIRAAVAQWERRHHRQPDEGGYGDHPGHRRQAHGPTVFDPDRGRGAYLRPAPRRMVGFSNRSVDGGRSHHPADVEVQVLEGNGGVIRAHRHPVGRDVVPSRVVAVVRRYDAEVTQRRLFEALASLCLSGQCFHAHQHVLSQALRHPR